jgi:transcription antitermination factor NusG
MDQRQCDGERKLPVQHVQQWYVMYTKPHKEALVNRQLEDRGVETFFPFLQFERGYGRGIRLEPFFPNYLFFCANLAQPAVHALRWLPGVRSIVYVDHIPAAVPEPVIQALRARLQPLAHRVLHKSEWLFEPGQPVSIIDGPLEGLEAVFHKGLSGQERAQVMVHWVGRWTRAELDLRLIKPLGQTQSIVPSLELNTN